MRKLYEAVRCWSHHRSAAAGSKVLGTAIFQSKQLPRMFCIKLKSADLRQPSTLSPSASRKIIPAPTPVSLGQAVVSALAHFPHEGRSSSKPFAYTDLTKAWVSFETPFLPVSAARSA